MPVYRAVVRGHSAVDDRWTFGMGIEALSGVANNLADAVANGVDLFWNGVPTNTNAAKTLFDTSTVVDDVVVSELDPTRRHNVDQAVSPLTIAGTGTGTNLPPQVAIACSIVTALPTRRGRGRFYLPSTTVDTVDGGRLATASRDLLAQAFENMVHSIQTADSNAYTVGIIHRDGVPADFTDIVAVRVGDVFDTQRRRRNKLKEAYDQISVT